MATHGDGEAEYESDPEDAPLPSMRRRVASDDEDGEGSGDGERPREGRVGSDGDSDEQGAAEVYEDDEEYYDEEDEEYGEVVGRGLDEEEAVTVDGDGRKFVLEEEGDSVNEARRSVGSEVVVEAKDKEDGEGEEKKENEPFAVPTSGAFYMHDDRFQENGRGRRRRMFGSQRLWDPKDEYAWTHDRFEEMNLQETHHNEEKRRSNGRFRGRRGRGRGYATGRPRGHNKDSENENWAPRIARGRGPRRYEPRFKNYRENTTAQPEQSPAKPSHETAINSGAGRPPSQSAGGQQNRVIPQKHSFSSSLNSASPPFYPSGSSSTDILIQKRDTQGGIDNKSLPYTRKLQDTSQTSNSNSMLRAKAMIGATGQDKSVQNVTPKPLPSSNIQSSGFSLPPVNVVQPPSSRSQGKGAINNTATPNNQLGRVSVHVPNQRPVHSPALPALRVTTQQMTQQLGSGNEGSPPPQPPLSSSEVGESDSPPGSIKSKTALSSKGKVNSQGSGRGSFLYGGAQVIGAAGAMGVAHGDQNFPGTPALLPVMQFGGQHASGLGVPAMGMALPGYVAQPQIGFGNSEMTWLPVLAGASGALGGSYCPPYIALDSSYYANQGQTASSRETGTRKSDCSLKTTQRHEIVNDELGQRQNKPRRYSEMSFGQ